MKSSTLKKLALTACFPGFALAQTTWNTPTTGGTWNTAANWSAGLPSGSVDALWNPSGASSLTLSTNATTTVGGITVNNTATAGTQAINTVNFAMTFNKTAAGNVAISNTGTRAITLQGRFVFTDPVDFSASSGGSITVQMNGAGLTGTGGFNILDGTVTLSRAASEITSNRAFTVGDGTGSAATASLRMSQNNMFGSSAGNNSSITVRSDGKLDLANTVGSNVLGTDATSASYLALQGGAQASQASGGTLIVRGTGLVPVIRVTNLGSAATATISGGTGTGTLQVDVATATSSGAREFSIAKNAASGVADLQISALISDGDDNMTFDKSGSGILEITSNNTATLDGTGAWNVNTGQLLANNLTGSATGASTMSVSVASGAALGGTGTISGGINFVSGADFVFNAAAPLNVTGNVTFGGFGVANLLGLDSATMAGTYVLLNGTGSNISQANVSNIGQGNAFLIPSSSNQAYFDFANGDLSLVVSAIPEPGSFALIGGLASIGFAGLRRRRRSA